MVCIHQGEKMEIKKVEGSFPQEFEELRGGTFINLYPVKKDGDGDNYEYFQCFTNKENVESEKIKMICEIYKDYLNKTDHKFFNGYKSKEGEDLAAIETIRDEYREFIRLNEVE